MSARIILRSSMGEQYWTGLEWHEIVYGEDWALAYLPYNDEPLRASSSKSHAHSTNVRVRLCLLGTRDIIDRS